ncbi:MAG: UDP-N-acetylmuramoyl-tripeptide--D-alanyl-D-alanine ligase [Firmicutes bacterium HGW-Firmicutes-8]|nr:MAG: UDP-N-acetylmuramoyl-tripeptide--D-alanyl-D-alanine ligase [Firmicutes bacterium HGW-Firmicutes-8]
MPTVTIGKLCEAVYGSLRGGIPGAKIKGIICRCTRVVPGLVYFDVKGGKGGDRNIIEAVKNGAIGVVVSKYKKVLPFEDKEIAVISVPKVWEAFWQAVKFYRDLYDIPVVGVTGTSGKTTTKEMIASIFRRRWKVLKTVGNMNLPDFVPSHILRLKWGYQAAVFEIGMNRPGHISKQARIIQPKVGVITHIGPAHVGPLGGFENVILEKAGIIQGIPDDGYLILNADDPNTKKIDTSGFRGTIIFYGLKNKADYMAEDVTNDIRGTSFRVKLDDKDCHFFIPTFGIHNVYNALAAIAAAHIFMFDEKTIRQGLAKYRKPPMRLQIVKGIRNSVLINDTYNANPSSMMAGLEVLSTLSKGKTGVAVLGNMLEQGSDAAENHRRVGKKAAELNIDWLITVGRLAKEIATGAALNSNKVKVWSFFLKKQAVEFLRANLPDNSVVLVKGSRGAYMENLVRRLKI